MEIFVGIVSITLHPTKQIASSAEQTNLPAPRNFAFYFVYEGGHNKYISIKTKLKLFMVIWLVAPTFC